MGMVGGGRDAFIGAVHRHAASIDGQIEFVAGALSADPEKARLSGQDLLLDPTRVYASYEEMAQREAALPEDRRIDFVSIVTPNHLHYPVARTFLEAGFNVVCDKPMTHSLVEAIQLRGLVKRTGKVFALTHNYTGYPMVKEARAMVRDGKLGTVRKVVSEYRQGWLSSDLENTGQKQSSWRTDPAQAGAAGCMGDIGTHAENLARYITGLKIDSLCAELTTFVKGRRLDDDGNVLVRYQSGAKGIVFASQISIGEENNLIINVYGTKAALEWHQEHPNELIVKYPDQPRQIYRRGNAYVGEAAGAHTRIPAGHPEAFIEAFANIYSEAAQAIGEEISGQEVAERDFPNVDDGVYGLAFIETCVKSAASNQKWVKFPAL